MFDPRYSAGRRIGVLFVCLGNICRSPMAESIFRAQVEQADLAGIITADSAGTGAWHVGQPPHTGTRQALQRRGLVTQHVARVVTQSDFTRYDYVIAMDRDNLRNLRSMGAAAASQLHLLMDFAPAAGISEIPDPYFDGRFEEVYSLIEAGCRGLLTAIVRAQHLTPTR